MFCLRPAALVWQGLTDLWKPPISVRLPAQFHWQAEACHHRFDSREVAGAIRCLAPPDRGRLSQFHFPEPTWPDETTIRQALLDWDLKTHRLHSGVTLRSFCFSLCL